MAYDLNEARRYLETGGLGEVIGMTDMARQMSQPKVQSDTDMAMALCLMASEALEMRKALAAWWVERIPRDEAEKRLCEIAMRQAEAVNTTPA